MTQHRHYRNIITLLLSALIILPVGLYYATHNKGIFYYWHALQTEAAQSGKIWKKHTKSADAFHLLTSLEGTWRFAPGDDSARSADQFDDSIWQTIYAPAYWENQGFEEHDGFGWYRREFTLNANHLRQALYLHLGKIDDVDEVYINGTRIGGRGQFPPTYITAWKEERRYPLPESVLREGANTLAVRVYDAQMGGGIGNGDLGIYTADIPPTLVNLEGAWQFRPDSATEYHSIQVPEIWENQGYPDYNGIAHYRKTFGKLDVDGEQTLVLILGRIDDTDKAYLNGTLIGSTGQLNASDRAVDSYYYRVPRRYEFPTALLRDENILEVQVHDSAGEGGIYEGPVAIVGKDGFRSMRNQTTPEQ